MSYRLGSDGDVFPVVGSEPFEEWAERWHAGGDQGEVVLDAAMGMVSSASARQGEEYHSQQGHDAVLGEGGIGRPS